jgi:hypothetical protein
MKGITSSSVDGGGMCASGGMIRARALDAGSGGFLGSGSGGGGILGSVVVVVVGSVDSDFDSNRSATDLFTLKSFNGFLLLFFATDVDETVTLAFPGLSPTPANDAGRGDGNTSICEQGRKTSIVDVEAEVGDEEHGLGLLADGVLSRRARGTRSLGFASARGLLGGSIGRSVSVGCSRSRGSAVFLLGLGLALQFNKC